MKRKWIIILPAVILFIGSYFLYHHFFWGRVVVISDVTKAQDMRLISDPPAESVRLHITGKLDGEALLFWGCHKTEACSHQEKLSSGDIDITQGDDWYEEDMIIRYQPSNNVRSGNIKIQYSL